MFPIINEVEPLADFKLKLSFKSGKKTIYDVMPLMNRFDAFKPLLTIKGLFENVKNERYGISWNDDIDIDSSELLVNGTACRD
ncbi:MAG: DUF2442 domain-containing protein [Alphaproteobacteria bacterium]|nr:DUF2442 domain-containing protein [Alphaproteobacteria bacterium]